MCQIVISLMDENQYVLDFSREEVVNYIYERMEAILSEAPISYIKWDMNRNITEIGSVGLAREPSV